MTRPADTVSVWAIVVAAGSGSRFGRAKQFELLDGERVVDRSVAAAASVVDGVVLVVPAEVLAVEASSAAAHHVVAGASTRSGSVRAGLAAVPPDADVVIVHDAARPLASAALYRDVIEAVRAGADGAIPGVAVTDTIKAVDDGPDGPHVGATIDRTRLVAVQTPQGFAADVLRRAHAGDPDATDDAALIEAAGGKVVVVPGEATNIKITHPLDLAVAAVYLEAGR